MPPRPKKPAHERNTANHSHSLGLAAPGRRILRSKSSLSDLNRQPASANTTSADTNGLPYSSCPSAFQDSPFTGLDTDSSSCAPLVNETTGDAAIMGSTQSHPVSCRRRTTSASSINDLEAHGADNPFTYSPMSSLSLDTSNTTVKPANQHKSKLAVATTILSACPLWDVIAILIILLQLPPTVISVVHGLFAIMTFVPPSSTLSLGNLPTFHEIVAVDPAGTPSLQTIFLVDALLMLCFVWLAVPAQNIILDLAQAVIAISLGGAAASQGQSTRSVICCLSIISLSHIMHWKSARQFGFRLVASTLKFNLPAETSGSSLSTYPDRIHTFPGKARSILGAHILAQGILKGVRRYISWTKNQSELQSSKKNDSDLFAGSTVSTPRTTFPPSDYNTEPGMNATGDGRPPGPSPSASGAKEKNTSVKKKKKKQATQVRVQQPFWAALASTKVTVAKEYEQSLASLDAQEAQAVDVTNLGDVDFANSNNRVWILEVGAMDVSFGVSLLLNQTDDDDENEMEPKRWFVRVNGASWHSIKSKLVERSVVGLEVLETWEARIYGLTPLSSYHCEVVVDAEHSVIFDTSLITQPAPFTETATVISSPTQTLQPSSPTTTLRNSIHAAEMDSEKLKNNFRVARKQHKSMLERLQSQIDREKSKASNTGGTDERQRQRAKQLENSIAKIKADQEETQHALNDMGDVPVSEKKTYGSAKDEAKTRQRKMDRQKSLLEKSRKESDKRVASAKAEIDAALHKRTRFEARQKEYATKLSDASKKAEHAAQAKSNRVNRKLESAAARRAQVVHWEGLNAELDRLIAEDQANYAALHLEFKQLEEWTPAPINGSNNPDLPEGALLPPSLASVNTGLSSNSLPGTRPSSLHVSHPGFSPSFTFPQLSSSPSTFSSSLLSGNTRRRASSLEASGLSAAEPSPAYHTPFSTSGLAAPPGFGHFSPTSSAALLANSTALAPAPGFSPLMHHTKPVGAEMDGSRRKGSNGSGHSLRGSDNGSPKMGNGTVGSGLRNGLVSPPASAIWEADGLRGL
ncbi:hypothetical protein BT63DRAFT_427643 [Microthyrium microscopicum]|uniref:Ubiquitination network signaling protein n=1 Tax=Microthyrium microscopicum TaxID=703497 RepID=A0A6A6U4L9_9PEZI|nr:hypothetical protein BT63DRAFT_427643 [Microthyrium microscopicum]